MVAVDLAFTQGSDASFLAYLSKQRLVLLRFDNLSVPPLKIIQMSSPTNRGHLVGVSQRLVKTAVASSKATCVSASLFSCKLVYASFFVNAKF